MPPPKNPSPPPPAVVIHAKHLETVRHASDDYTTTEYLLEGDGRTWRTTGSRVICEHKSRNVTTDYVRDWWLNRVGRNGVGDFD